MGTLGSAAEQHTGVSPAALSELMERQSERRRQIFVRLSDLSFGLLMFLFADLQLTATVGGVTVDASDSRVEPAAKLSALLGGLVTSTRSSLLREFVRPLLTSAAELCAELFGPDPHILTLLLCSPQRGAVKQAAPAPVPLTTHTMASPPALRPANGSQYEGRLLQADNGSPSVWFIEGGKRRGIWAPHILRMRFKSEPVNGRWDNVLYVPATEINAIPLGQPLPSPYEGRLLQAGKPDEVAAATLGVLLGPAAGIGSALLNLVPADPTVWHIVGGKRQGLGSEAVLRARYGATWEQGLMNGHWTKVMLVPAAIIKEFPVGPTETTQSGPGSGGRSSSGTLPGAPPG